MGEPPAAEVTVEGTTAVPPTQQVAPAVVPTSSASSASSENLTISMPAGDPDVSNEDDEDGAAASTEGDDADAAGETAAERTVNAKRAWTDEEDTELLATVARLGPQRWSLISSHLTLTLTLTSPNPNPHLTPPHPTSPHLTSPHLT